MPHPIHLKHHTITGSRPGPRLLITGGVHGDEYEPMAAVRRLITLVKPADLAGRLTLIPTVNESAFERRARCAADGLDLARTFPGLPPESADATITHRIAHEAAKFIRDADYYIDLHTGGLALKAMPMSGYTLIDDPAVLAKQRAMARAFNLPIIWGTTPKLNGRSLSVARDARVPAIYAEWGGGGGCDPAGVQAYVDGCLNVMASLGMIDRAMPADAVRTVVEDNRENSGHMQINYNATAAGYFEPAAKLGDHVNPGDSVGHIVSPVGQVLQTMRFHQQGLVLVLRTLPAVQPGDCLAVVLETAATPSTV